MTIIRQSSPAFALTITPDAGLETQSISVFGWPALVLAIGPPGSLTTAGSDEAVAAIIRQTAPALGLVLGEPGALLIAGAPAAAVVIRQSSPAFALALGGAGTVLAIGQPTARVVIRQSTPAFALALPGPAGTLETASPPPLDIRIVIGAPRRRWAAGRVWA
ncbi:hypothetical protein DQ384_05345 [Sphaerisporangium album]|uniref:Uncharacterized protein n=1 Tax=Sphaerisporangium album TaxID=509200 RepID=A0A367FNL4_9ACTN|nr:hypothetical protein [Sphaerisporangium album]RCG31968.1 hypothetical protein DQ384_05345 [Sphaerisporangium album]